MTRKRAENDQLLEQLEGFHGEKKSFDLRQRQGSANMDSKETKQPIWDPISSCVRDILLQRKCSNDI